MTLNRTKVELKLDCSVPSKYSAIALNRTKVELKQEIQSTFADLGRSQSYQSGIETGLYYRSKTPLRGSQSYQSGIETRWYRKCT